MTRRSGKDVIIEPAPPDKCEVCGATAELRPYGVGGAAVCFPCAMKTPEVAEAAFAKLIGVPFH